MLLLEEMGHLYNYCLLLLLLYFNYAGLAFFSFFFFARIRQWLLIN